MCLPLSQGHGWMASIKENEGGLLTPSAPLWEEDSFVHLGKWKLTTIQNKIDMFCIRYVL